MFKAAVRRVRNDSVAQIRKTKSAYLKKQHDRLSNLASGSYHWWQMAKLGKISAEKPTVPELDMSGVVASTDKG